MKPFNMRNIEGSYIEIIKKVLLYFHICRFTKGITGWRWNVPYSHWSLPTKKKKKETKEKSSRMLLVWRSKTWKLFCLQPVLSVDFSVGSRWTYGKKKRCLFALSSVERSSKTILSQVPLWLFLFKLIVFYLMFLYNLIGFGDRWTIQYSTNNFSNCWLARSNSYSLSYKTY